MRGKLRLNTTPGRQIAVLDATTGAAATLYTDLGSEVPLGTHVITANSFGGALAYCSGRFKLTDVATGVTLRDVVDVVQLKIAPSSWDAAADGTTDDIEAIDSAIAAAANMPFQNAEGNSLVLDFEGRQFAISRPIVNTVERLTISNFAVRAIGAGWNGTTFMLSSLTSAPQTVWLNVNVDGNRLAAGIDLSAGRSKTIRCNVYHFRGTGIRLAGASGDCAVEDCLVNEWLNGDPEFLIDAEYVATGIYVNRADCHVTLKTISRWSKYPLRVGPLGHTLTVDGGTHVYNGGSGLLVRTNPVNILLDAGSGGSINGCYIDNGSIEQYSPGWDIRDNRALYNTDACTLTHWHAVYANGQTGPYQLDSGEWQSVSGALRDGSIPFMTFPDNGADSWAGDYSAFVAATGKKSAHENQAITRLQTDDGLSVTYYAPGTGGASGAGVGLVSASTPVAVRPDPASLRENKGQAYLYRAGRPIQAETASLTLFLNTSGKQVLMDNPLAADVTLPQDAQPGWHCWLSLGDDSAAAVTIKAKAAYPLSSVHYKYGLGTIEMFGPRACVEIVCESNSVDLDAAVFVVSGDAENDQVKVIGNGFTYLQYLDTGREVLVENTAATTVVLPYFARVGWRVQVTRSAASTAAVLVQANVAEPTSVLWGSNEDGDVPLSLSERVEFVCVANADGESAIFAHTGSFTETFTPTVTFDTPGNLAVVYTVQYGYISVLNGMAYVHVVLEFTPTFTTASGTMFINGMPVVPSSAQPNPPLQCSADATGLDWGAGHTQLRGRANSTGQLALKAGGSTTAEGNISAANITSGTAQVFQVFGHFRV